MPAKPEAPSILFLFVWLIFMVGMIVTYIIVLIALWRTMKAHERIAERIGAIAEKFQLK